MREHVLLMRVSALEREVREVAAFSFKQHVLLSFLMDVLRKKGTVTDDDVKDATEKLPLLLRQNEETKTSRSVLK